LRPAQIPFRKSARRMRRRGWCVGLCCLALLVLTAPARAVPQPQLEGFGEVAARLLPSVVNISTTQTIKSDAKAKPEESPVPPGSPFEEFFKNFLPHHGLPGDRQQSHKATSLGSGFVVDAAGLIVTNNHVIADADEITVILQDDTTIKAQLVGRDEKTDLALLRVKTDHALVAVPFGDSDKARVGDWVLAVGNPFGLGGTLTAGIISARSREINNNNGPYDDFLQTDAAINKGNSGGPLFNLNGEVIGINSAIFSPSGGSIGIGFAIPASLARNIVGQIQQYGHVRRGWLGARTQSVDDGVARALGLDHARGALVADLIEKSPALQSGIQPGDIILALDGKPVADIRHLQRLVVDAPIDRPVRVTLWRKRQEKTIEVKLTELDESEAAQQTASLPKPDPKQPSNSANQAKALGLVVAEATAELKEKYQLGENAAVVVTSVAKGSPAGEKDVKPGDVIVEIAQEEVKNPADIPRKVDEARKAGRKTVLMLVDRAGELRFVAVRIDHG
jgi:serine protease Do